MVCHKKMSNVNFTSQLPHVLRVKQTTVKQTLEEFWYRKNPPVEEATASSLQEELPSILTQEESSPVEEALESRQITPLSEDTAFQGMSEAEKLYAKIAGLSKSEKRRFEELCSNSGREIKRQKRSRDLIVFEGLFGAFAVCQGPNTDCALLKELKLDEEKVKSFNLTQESVDNLKFKVDEILSKMPGDHSDFVLTKEFFKEHNLPMVDVITWYKLESKTQTLLRTILVEKEEEKTLDRNVKPIFICVQDCSLSLCQQYRIRARNIDNKSLLVKELSSSSAADYHHVSEFITDLDYAMKDCNFENIPDVLIMCGHRKRTRDIVQILEHYTGYEQPGQVSFTLHYDEADKTRCEWIRILKRKDLYECRPEANILRKVVFATATPFQKFWSTLKKSDHRFVKNIRGSTGNDVNEQLSHKDYHNAVKYLYRGLNKHLAKFEPQTTDFHEYQKTIYKNKIANREDGRKIIFAPALNENKTHDKVAEFFSKLGYTIVILNQYHKGFLSQNIGTVTFDQFHKMYKMPEGTEMFHMLAKYAISFPDTNIVVTGYNNINRGLTVSTLNFMFTDAIICLEHAKNIETFIQMIHRLCGDVKYTKSAFLHIDKRIHDKALQYAQIQMTNSDPNITTFSEQDFKYSARKSTYVYQSYDSMQDLEKDWLEVYHFRKPKRFVDTAQFVNKQENGFLRTHLESNYYIRRGYRASAALFLVFYENSDDLEHNIWKPAILYACTNEVNLIFENPDDDNELSAFLRCIYFWSDGAKKSFSRNDVENTLKNGHFSVATQRDMFRLGSMVGYRRKSLSRWCDINKNRSTRKVMYTVKPLYVKMFQYKNIDPEVPRHMRGRGMHGYIPDNNFVVPTTVNSREM